ncbi:hypothetical protein EPN16_07145 [bacterium]|nr:MAG: hypothetical protein EPN16_07145 [bacterium]
MLKKLSLIILSNLIFILYFLHYYVPLGDFTLSLTINFMVFILPGVGWLNVFFRRGISDRPAFTFWTAFLSTVLFTAGILIHLALRININSFSQFIYLAVVTNIGILISRFSLIDKKEAISIRTFSRYFIICILFLTVYTSAYISSVYITPPLEDHDFERQATAYGLVKHFRPYLLTDRKTLFYFAHPPLMHFYSAYTMLFSDKLDRMKYYYDIAVEAADILKKEFQQGDTFCFSDSHVSGMCAEIIEVKNGYLRFDARLPEKIDIGYNRFVSVSGGMLDIDTVKKARLWQLIKEEYSYFNNQPYLLETRMPNLLFSALAAMVFFYLTFHLTKSWQLSLLGTFVFFTLPQVFILSAAGLDIALTNFLLISLAYGYITFRKFNVGESLTLFSIGLLSAWATQVAVILPMAVIAREYLLYLKSPRIKQILGSPAVTGFICGTVLFWIYGMIIDSSTFFLDHIRYHIWDRIFHINSLGYGSYPSIYDLWKRFAYELGYPLFFLGAGSLLVSLLKAKIIDVRETVLSFWSLIGAIVFSIVDWKDSAHLVFVIPALIIVVCIFVSRQKFNIKLWLILILFYAVFRNIWFIFKISENFQLIEPPGGW